MLNETSRDNQSLASKSLELEDETFKFLQEQLLQDENFKKPFSDEIIKKVEAKTDRGKATVVEEPADQEPILSRLRREKVKPGQALVLVEEVPASRIPTKSDSSEFFVDIEAKEKQALSMLNEVESKQDKKRQADIFEVASESKMLKMVVVDDEAATIPKEGSLKTLEHELKEKEVEKASGERENVQVVILDEEKLKEEKRKGEEEEQTERSKRQKEEKEASNEVENLEWGIFERLERNQVLPSEGDEQLEQEPRENLQEQEEKGEKEDKEEEEEKKKRETEKEKRDEEERKKQEEEMRRKEEEREKNREEKEKEEKLNRLETELKKKKEKEMLNQGATDKVVEENEGSNLESSEAKGRQEYTESSGKALVLQDSGDTNLDGSVPAKESHNGVHSPISSGALEVSNVGAIPISLSTLIPTIGLASVSI